MSKEILLYSDIYGWTAERAISDLNEARNQSEVTVRFNGDGGELRYGWAIIGKAKELKGKKLFKNDGEANSMMAFAFCYNENNEALDTSVFKFHRASYGMNYEASEYFTDAERTELAEKNAKLRAAMESKINVAKFTELKKCTIDELFAMPGRVEVCVNAEEALAIGLINKIVPITPEYKAQITALSQHFSPLRAAAQTETSKTMTVEQIKAQFPDAYKAIYALGVDAEHDRAGSILAYLDADPKGCIEAFKGGKSLTETQRSEFAIKAQSKKSVDKLEIESPGPTPVLNANSAAVPVDGKKPEDEKTQAAIKAALDAEFRKLYPNSKKVA